MIGLHFDLNNKKNFIKLKNYRIEDGYFIRDYYISIVAIYLTLEIYQKDLI